MSASQLQEALSKDETGPAWRDMTIAVQNGDGGATHDAIWTLVHIYEEEPLTPMNVIYHINKHFYGKLHDQFIMALCEHCPSIFQRDFNYDTRNHRKIIALEPILCMPSTTPATVMKLLSLCPEMIMTTSVFYEGASVCDLIFDAVGEEWEGVKKFVCALVPKLSNKVELGKQVEFYGAALSPSLTQDGIERQKQTTSMALMAWIIATIRVGIPKEITEMTVKATHEIRFFDAVDTAIQRLNFAQSVAYQTQLRRLISANPEQTTFSLVEARSDKLTYPHFDPPT